MEQYYLFLDESKPNSNFENFTLAGVVIKNDTYESIIKPELINIKSTCFGNDAIILHETDIRGKSGEFVGITYETQCLFFDKMKELLSRKIFDVLAVTVNINDLNSLFSSDSRNDIYYIALQLLLENYAHYLENKNAIGNIYLETTDPSNDSKLQNLYYTLLSTGTLFLRKETLQARLKTINFAIKSDNILGLQLADFIPNPIARNALKKSQKPNSLFNEINCILYDGGINKPSRFGCKEIS